MDFMVILGCYVVFATLCGQPLTGLIIGGFFFFLYKRKARSDAWEAWKERNTKIVFCNRKNKFIRVSKNCLNWEDENFKDYEDI